MGFKIFVEHSPIVVMEKPCIYNCLHARMGGGVDLLQPFHKLQETIPPIWMAVLAFTSAFIKREMVEVFHLYSIKLLETL